MKQEKEKGKIERIQIKKDKDDFLKEGKGKKESRMRLNESIKCGITSV